MLGHDAVDEQSAKARDVGGQSRPAERLCDEGRLPGALAVEAQDVAGGEVRAGPVERTEQQLAEIGRELVVAVDEAEELSAGDVGAGVAGFAETAVGLRDEPEAVIALGVPAGDGGGVVGRAVVDHDHLDIAEGLVGDRVEALLEVALDVEDRHDHAHSWSVCGWGPGATCKPHGAPAKLTGT